MQELIKDILLVSLGRGIGRVAMCLVQAESWQTEQ